MPTWFQRVRFQQRQRRSTPYLQMHTLDFVVVLVAAASEKQGEIEQALIAGIKSGSAEPWTDDEWQVIRIRLVSKASSY